ncbi:MAG: hypothetical protein K2V38_09670 [Gemmataceae bacterium]|nr:hypothetical protein [Gemmataceae bacterium]
MADAHETGRPALTAADAVFGLFAPLLDANEPGRDIVWLADQLLGAVQHFGSVTLERTAEGVVCQSGEQTRATDRVAARLFRPLLARLAVIGVDETGAACDPYSGRYALVRSSRTGPVRLEVAFTNTPAAQRLTIERVPIATSARQAPPAPVEPTPTQPSA